MHILLQTLFAGCFLCSISSPLRTSRCGTGKGCSLRQSDFEQVAPLSVGQGDVSAAVIYFTSQKWRDFADNHYQSGSSAPSAGCQACKVRGQSPQEPRWGLNWENGLEQLGPAACPWPPSSPVPSEVAVGRGWRRDKGGPRPKITAGFPWASHPSCHCCKGKQLWTSTPHSAGENETFEVRFCLSWLGCSVPNSKCSSFSPPVGIFVNLSCRYFGVLKHN